MKKVDIIGAGLAGLSAGICLQKAGIQTEIFELADWAGGMCTSWVRKGYRFDGCIDWMVGTKPGDSFHDNFLEVGALEKDTVIYYPDFIQHEIDGTLYTIPLKFEEFKAFFCSLSPEDGKSIDELCNAISAFMREKMPVEAPKNPVQFIKMMKESGSLINVSRKYISINVEKFASQFKNQTVRKILCELMPPKFSVIPLMMMLGTRMGHNAGYPMGGSLDVIKRMEEKYRSLGGTIRLNSKVDEIIVENGAATGIKAGGTFYPSDYVIAACDAYDTLNRMLGGKYPHPQLDTMLSSSSLFKPLALISFGLNKKFGLPYETFYECPEGIQAAPGVIEKAFNMQSFEFDPSSAPEGCSSVMFMLEAPLDYWKNLRENDKIEYAKQKQLLAEAATDAADRRIPGFRSAIEVVDVSTPATYVRLANLYQGSWEGFQPTPEALMTRIHNTIPGLKSFVLCGQWTNPGGGTCTAVASGKEAAKIVQKEL